MTLTRRRLFDLALVGAVALAGCSSSGGGDGSGDDGGRSVVETTDVAMADGQFDPRNVHVDAGATVTWVNEDSAGHTVTSASDNWEFDATVDGGGETTHTFDSDGVYDVYCRFHGSADLSGMSMKVGVGAATVESPLGSASGSGDGVGDDSGVGY